MTSQSGVRGRSRNGLGVAVAALGLAWAAFGCSTNPATGKRQLSLIGLQQEIALGRESHPQVLAQFGLVPDEALQSWVQEVGLGLAATSESPDLPWTFSVVDDPIVNAFALPGGFIYLSRGILAHVGSEAELAGILGHEIGHVTGRHGVEQMSRAQLAGLGLGVAAVSSREVREWSGLLGGGLQLAFLKFGRDDERESDRLGLRYLRRAGYDPREMPKVFATLDRLSQAANGGRIPTWQSTHPDPGARAQSLRDAVAALPIEQREGRVERASYLQRLDGLVFGTNPREGYTVGRTFYHPDLAFRLDFPQEWQVVNQRQQVGAIHPERDAIVVLSLAEGSASEARDRFLADEGIEAGGTLGHGLRQFRTALSEQGGGRLYGAVGFLEHRGVTLRLLGYSTEAGWRSRSRPVIAALRSFRELTERRYLEVQPKRLEIVELPRAMSLSDFAEQYPSSLDKTRLAILNGASAEEVLPAGTLMKRVVGGELPEP